MGLNKWGQSKPTEMVNTFLLSGAEVADRLNCRNGVRVKGQSKPTEMVNTFLLSGAEIAGRLN